MSYPLPLIILYGKYLKLYIARGSVDDDSLARLMPVQSSAEGRVIGYTTLSGVCLLRADYLVSLLKILLICAHLYDAAKGDCVFWNVFVHVVNDLGVPDKDFQLCYLGIELALLGLRFIVLTVFQQIAEASCFLDQLGDLFLSTVSK